MKISFTKYQGAGNDFVMLNNLDGSYENLTMDHIQFLCDRKLGVGADGLIKLSASSNSNFLVEYFNADGSQSFCGNGARCSVAYAKELGVVDEDVVFEAIDGFHKASFINEEVRLEMLPVLSIEKIGNDYILDTGSPHYVRISDEKEIDIVSFGKEIRFSDLYKKNGINVNLVYGVTDTLIEVQTYERGVEDETLSCGTGVTACALVWMSLHDGVKEVNINTKGGKLKVEAERSLDGYSSIWLTGPAKHVFKGSIDV